MATGTDICSKVVGIIVGEQGPEERGRTLEETMRHAT
jgi:hypothetical protein